MPMPVGGRLGRSSRFLVEYDAWDGLDRVGLPTLRSGQTPTYARGTGTHVTTVLDRLGQPYTPAAPFPAYHHAVNPTTGLLEPVGILLEAGDLLTIPLRRVPGALALYLRLWRGAVDAPGAVVAALGGVTGASIVISESAASGYTATFSDGVTAYASTVGTRLTVGEFVELLVAFDPAATDVITLYQSVAGARDERGSASGLLPTGAPPVAWGTPNLYVGAAPSGANPAGNAYAGVVVATPIGSIAGYRPATYAQRVQASSVPRLTESGVTRRTESGVTRYTE